MHSPKIVTNEAAEVLAHPGFEACLIDGESAADFEAFLADCLSAIGPQDAIERVWLEEFVQCTWEIRRLRKFRSSYLHAERQDALYRLLHQLGMELMNAKGIALKWMCSDREARRLVDGLLRVNGMSVDTITAKAAIREMRAMETIDKLIASNENRRNSAIRELERRREGLAKRAREFAAMSADLVEADYVESEA